MNNTPTYLTTDGLENLKKDLKDLKAKMPEIAKRINEAKELGDLRENAEYHMAKEDYAFTQGKIFEIEDMLKRVVAIEKNGNATIRIGSTIKIKNLSNQKEIEYTIVGSNEAFPQKGFISNESPLAQAFLNHKKGDRIEVITPVGSTGYTILEVK